MSSGPSSFPPIGEGFFIICTALGLDVYATVSGASGDGCIPIVMKKGGNGDNRDLWYLRKNNDGVNYGFQNASTGAWITAKDNDVVACTAYEPQSCTWKITSQDPDHPNASLVHFPLADLTWQVRPNGYLALGSAKTAITGDKLFSFGESH